MKNHINFDKLFKPMLLLCGGIALVGILFLLLFGGKTEAHFTLSNLRFSLFIKLFVTAFLAVLFTTGYFALRVKNKGLFFSLYTAASATVNAIISFFFCVIFRAPLGEITFAVMLISVFLTYLIAVIYVSNITSNYAKKKKKTIDKNFEAIAENTFKTVLPLFFVIALSMCVVFAVSLICSVGTLALYAIPVMASTAFTLVFTLSFGCKLYMDMI